MKSRRSAAKAASIVAGLVVAVALAVPAGAGAYTGDLDQEYRSSWYNYVHFDWTGPGPQNVHDLIPTSGATEPSTNLFDHGFDDANTDYDQGSDEGQVAYDGHIQSRNDAHYIDVRVSDLRIEVDGNAAVVTAGTQYLPLGGSLTALTRIDFATADLTSKRSTSGDTTTWTDVVLELTADGATVFNGGGFGSYTEGTEFGSIDFTVTDQRRLEKPWRAQEGRATCPATAARERAPGSGPRCCR
jgi:large repetitive protein